jgi:hypothetical protein
MLRNAKTNPWAGTATSCLFLSAYNVYYVKL